MLQCKTIVAVYGEDIIDLLKLLGTPQAICEKIDLCEKPAGHVKLLGGKKCTWGPDYWCKSPQHASACGVSFIVIYTFKL